MNTTANQIKPGDTVITPEREVVVSRPAPFEELRVLPAPNYRVAQDALAQLHPFKHSTMSARWEKDDEGHWVYVVLSYKTPVAWVGEYETTISPNHWSVTTGKHLGYARRNLPAPEEGWAQRS